MALKPVLVACPPRDSIASADSYAANLDAALREEIATPQGALEFFQTTYATDAISRACRMAFSRLKYGKASGQPSIYRFSSVYGGGKTHTQIAMAAVAKHPEVCRNNPDNLISPDLAVDGVAVVSFNGKNADVVDGMKLDAAGNRAKSLAGVIAYHAGGAAALEAIRNHDDSLSDPGGAYFANLFGNRPALILIDELVEWVARMVVSDPEYGGAKAGLCISALCEAVAQCEKVALVVTTPEPGHDAFQRNIAQLDDIMGEIAATLARESYEMTPSAEADLPAILRRRLFAAIDDDAAAATAEAYAAIAQRYRPDDHDAEARFRDAYPFHPSLIRIIQRQLAMNRDFQRVRGTIRLLTNIVRRMAEQGSRDALIHPHHADFADKPISDHLIATLHHEGIAPAIGADVAGPDSVAAKMGAGCGAQIAATIMLGSLSTDEASGLTEHEIVSAVLAPRPEVEGASGIRTDDAGVVAGELRRYLNAALYLDENRSASGRYRFTSEPNVRRMVNDRKDRFRAPNYLADRVKDALIAEYSAPRGKGDALGLKVYPGKNDNAADDRNQCQLAVMPADYFNWRNAQAQAHILAELYEWRSGGNDPRQHKNAIVFLVADNNDLSVLQEQIVTRAAGEALKQENPNLPARQRQLLDEIIAQAGKDVSQAVQNKWTHLFYPAGGEGFSPQAPGLRHEQIAVATDKANRGQEAVLGKLAERNKIPNPANPRLNPAEWSNTRLGGVQESEGMTLAELHRSFTASPARPMMTGRVAFRNCIIEAIKAGDLEVATGTGETITADKAHARFLDDECRAWMPGKRPAPPPAPAPPLPPSLPAERAGGGGPLPAPAPPGIPDFTGDTFKADYAFSLLDGHMKQHNANWDDVDSLVIMCDDLSAVTWLLDRMGAAAAPARCRVTIAGGTVSIGANDQTPDQWRERERTFERVRGYAGNPAPDAAIEFFAGADFDAIVAAMDSRYDVTLQVSFR